MISIDGSMGEGGGQLIRSALSLSLVTGEPFVMRNIRAGRKRPGLMRQHLTSVLAAQAVGEADVEGASVASTELTFKPRSLRGGDLHFAVGTAGSTMLVLQTVLVPLLRATLPSTLTIEGGTHNPTSPPFEFVSQVFLPVLARMGAQVDAKLERHGFYPAGGGRVRVLITPSDALSKLELQARGALVERHITALVSNLPDQLGQRELEVLLARLGWDRSYGRVVLVPDSLGPGNALLAELVFEHATELLVGFGEKGISAEHVGEQVAHEVQRFIASDVPVGEHLADQLLLPMALGAGGMFRTLELTSHATTQIELIRMFIGTQITVERENEDACRVEVFT